MLGAEGHPAVRVVVKKGQSWSPSHPHGITGREHDADDGSQAEGPFVGRSERCAPPIEAAHERCHLAGTGECGFERGALGRAHTSWELLRVDDADAVCKRHDHWSVRPSSSAGVREGSQFVDCLTELRVEGLGRPYACRGGSGRCRQLTSGGDGSGEARDRDPPGAKHDAGPQGRHSQSIVELIVRKRYADLRSSRCECLGGRSNPRGVHDNRGMGKYLRVGLVAGDQYAGIRYARRRGTWRLSPATNTARMPRCLVAA